MSESAWDKILAKLPAKERTTINASTERVNGERAKAVTRATLKKIADKVLRMDEDNYKMSDAQRYEEKKKNWRVMDYVEQARDIRDAYNELAAQRIDRADDNMQYMRKKAEKEDALYILPSDVQHDVWAQVVADARREEKASERFKRFAKIHGRSMTPADSPYPMPPRTGTVPNRGTTNLVAGCRWVKVGKGQADGGILWRPDR